VTSPPTPARPASDYLFPALGTAAFVVGLLYFAIMIVFAITAGVASGETSNAAYGQTSDRAGWAAVIGAGVFWIAGAALSFVRIRGRAKVWAILSAIANLGAVVVVATGTVLLQLFALGS